MPTLPLAYVLACGSAHGRGRGQLVLSHIQTRTCQPWSSLANHGRPIPATVFLRRNLRQSSTFGLLSLFLIAFAAALIHLNGDVFATSLSEVLCLDSRFLMFSLRRPGMYPPAALLIPARSLCHLSPTHFHLWTHYGRLLLQLCFPGVKLMGLCTSLLLSTQGTFKLQHIVMVFNQSFRFSLVCMFLGADRAAMIICCIPSLANDKQCLPDVITGH